MKRKLALVLVFVLSLSLVACTNNNVSNSEDNLETQIVGKWECPEASAPDNGVSYMELYEGGTGKGGYKKLLEEGSYYPITWEVSGEVINITASNTPTIGFKYENNTLVCVGQNETVYERVE